MSGIGGIEFDSDATESKAAWVRELMEALKGVTKHQFNTKELNAVLQMLSATQVAIIGNLLQIPVPPNVKEIRGRIFDETVKMITLELVLGNN